ncbi:MAG: hypothetical protein JWQ98_2861 [Chlorobi bacterium]|nr:hypothetical protein [Chlorobiota bacterium]
MNLGAPEIIVIMVILLLLFGGKKIPELMRGLGSGMKEFKKATSIHDDEPEPTPRTYDRQLDSRATDERLRLDQERRDLEEQRRLLEEERRQYQARQ